jgi:hypothetical protein
MSGWRPGTSLANVHFWVGGVGVASDRFAGDAGHSTRANGSIGRSGRASRAFRHDAFAAELASVLEDATAVMVLVRVVALSWSDLQECCWRRVLSAIAHDFIQ